MRQSPNHPILRYFIEHPVSANLLMFGIIFGGLYVAGFFGAFSQFGLRAKIDLESFPSIETQEIVVSASLNGSTAEDVEKALTNKLEEAIKSIEGIDEYRSTSTASSANITIEAETGYDMRTLLDDVQSAVDTVNNLPNEVEKITVSEEKSTRRILWVSVSATETSEKSLKRVARILRDRLLESEDINNVLIRGEKTDEIRIEISEDTLYRHQLTFDEISTAIQASSFDLAVGNLKSNQGDITLRINSQAYLSDDFADIVIRSQANGSQLKLGEVATIVDGLGEQIMLSQLNGENNLTLEVRSLGKVNVIAASAEVRRILKNFNQAYPNVRTEVWNESTKFVEQRLDFFKKSAFSSMLLVFLILALFLNLRLSFWVAFGIPLSFLGALIAMYYQGISISMVSLFGFIAVLGIVVDDAIVIGESIYEEKRLMRNAPQATYQGLVRVSTPATFGVLTTVAAFFPLTQLTGKMDSLMGEIAYVVIFCLIFSLVESKLILPSHLHRICIDAHQESNNGRWRRVQLAVNRGMQRFIRKIYQPTLTLAIRHRYITLLGFIGLFVLSLSLVFSGVVKTQIMPQIEGDFIRLWVTMEPTVAGDKTREYAQKAADSASKIRDQLQVEKQTQDGVNPVPYIYMMSSDDSGFYVFVVLAKDAERNFSADDFVKRWRQNLGYVEGNKSVDFMTMQRFTNADLEIEVYADGFAQANAVVDVLQKRLANFAGVSDIRTDLSAGLPEIDITLKPQAELYGINKSMVASEVRAAFYGREAQRVQRGEDEVKVMISYPKQDRQSFADLLQLRIRTASGGQVPISSVADLKFATGYASIQHINGRVALTVLANLDKTQTSIEVVNQSLNTGGWLDDLANAHNVTFYMGGEAEANKKSKTELGIGFVASLLMIYCLLAIPLKSYSKPFIIMSVIPFGIIGAIFGHLLTGRELTMLSFFGVLALSGVVVNDSLVFVSSVIDYRDRGMSLSKALILTGQTRFRPIILTSLTTFMGLMPVLIETSLQAQFLIPMAISLGFGIVFATLLTLILVPILYYIVGDCRRLLTGEPQANIASTA